MTKTLEHSTRTCRRCAMPVLAETSSCVACIPTDAAPPTSIGPFEVIRQLGSGAVGTVYRCRSVDGRDVAVKVLSWPRRPELTDRWVQDTRVLARVDHSSIVRIHATGHARVGRYMVMELIDGVSIARLADRHGKLATGLALTVIRAAASALGAARTFEITHRALRPSSLFIRLDGSVALSDFAQAIPYQLGDELQMAPATWHAVRYLAPETVHRGLVDHRSDIYSLGLTLFRLLTGLDPPGVSNSEQGARLPPVNMIAPELPVSVARLVAQMTRPRPADRPATFADIVEEIDTVGITLGTKPTSPIGELFGA